MTALDAARAAMEVADDDAPRRAFWSMVAAHELHLWLEAEAEGETINPRLFEIDGMRYALAFDTEDRLAGFVGCPAPHATLSGRRLAALLAESSLGLGLNFGARSETLLPPDLVGWLAETAAVAPETDEGRPAALSPPVLPQALVEALDRRLAAADGLARRAWLAQAEWDGGRMSHLLAIEETIPGAAEPIARSVAEGLAFAGEDAALDVTAVAPGSPLAERLERIALRFDLPEPAAPEPRDPSRPPRLR